MVQIEKRGVVPVFVKHRGAAIATVQHMVGVAGDLSAGNARHVSGKVPELGVFGKVN